MKKKYFEYYLIKIKDNNYNIYENDKLISNQKKNILDEIIKKYKLPLYLNPLYIINQSIDQADNNLVYFGIDCNNKTQYIYGKNIIYNRNKNRINIFYNIYYKIKEINKFINSQKFIKNNITLDNLMAVLLLLELNTFLRTGKKTYYDNNNTSGILTLLTSSIKLEKNYITIELIGKKKVKHFFKIENPKLIKYIKLIYNKNNKFLFTTSNNNVLSETYFYKTLKKFNITLKDIRTYGVNILILNDIYNFLKNNETLNINMLNNLIDITYKKVASIIGHSLHVSKNSYIINNLNNIILNNYKRNIKYNNFDDFINRIINYE